MGIWGAIVSAEDNILKTGRGVLEYGLWSSWAAVPSSVQGQAVRDPSLLSYSALGLLLGPLLPSEIHCPLHWASWMLTTLPSPVLTLATDHLLPLRGTPSLPATAVGLPLPEPASLLLAIRVPACCSEPHGSPGPPPNRTPVGA